MDLFFNAKLLKIGTSQGVIIPKGLADILDKDKKYCFSITEENGKNSETDLD